MVYCPNCGTALNDGAVQCPSCGTMLYQNQGYPAAPADPSDHSAEFDAKDISDNKVFAMAAYLLSALGIVIALLAAQKSDYAMFHVRQAVKIEVLNVLLALISAILCFTLIVPVAGAICMAILFVVRIILFFHVCAGKAKDAPIVGKLNFLK